MFEKIKKLLGFGKTTKTIRGAAFVVSNYPEKGWTIKNPSFEKDGIVHSISWLKVADFRATGTDQFERRILPNGMFNYSGLVIDGFTNCRTNLRQAKDAKAELESFINALSEAKYAKFKIKHKKRTVDFDLTKLAIGERPVLKTIGPKGAKKKGFDDEMNLSEKEMEKVFREKIVG